MTKLGCGLETFSVCESYHQWASEVRKPHELVAQLIDERIPGAAEYSRLDSDVL